MHQVGKATQHFAQNVKRFVTYGLSKYLIHLSSKHLHKRDVGQENSKHKILVNNHKLQDLRVKTQKLKRYQNLSFDMAFITCLLIITNVCRRQINGCQVCVTSQR